MTVRTGAAAGTWARSQVGKSEFHNMCKAFVRTAFQVDPSRSGTAIECFREAVHKYTEHNHAPDSIPAFVPVFMDTAASAEHVVITVGRNAAGHRLCVSTDAGPNHTIGLVRLDLLAASWGPILGWTEDFDGQRIWTPPVTAPSKPVPPLEYRQLVNGVNDDHEFDIDKCSALQRTAKPPYADAANTLHDGFVELWGDFIAATKK